jgi:hypothetical protein
MVSRATGEVKRRVLNGASFREQDIATHANKNEEMSELCSDGQAGRPVLHGLVADFVLEFV